MGSTTIVTDRSTAMTLTVLRIPHACATLLRRFATTGSMTIAMDQSTAMTPIPVLIMPHVRVVSMGPLGSCR
jgi:hypothetical protein